MVERWNIGFQKDPDHNKANQGQNETMTKEMGKRDSLFKETEQPQAEQQQAD
jgi:hypothetical protein